MARFRTAARHLLLNFVAALCLVVVSGVADATEIGPGLDGFTTLPGSEVDLSFLLPSVGVIAVESNPFGPNGVDTIIERIQGIDPFNVCPTPPCVDTIDIELVALSLTSVSPVDLSDLGGPFIGVFSDIYFNINKDNMILGLAQPDFLNPSIGQMELTHTDIFGGTFESCLGNASDSAGVCAALGVPGGGVYADAIFTVVGGDPSNPLDVFFSAAGPRLAVSGINGIWEHDVPGIGGGLKVISVEDTCNFPPCHEPIEPVSLNNVPEPGTATLIGVGLLMLGFRRAGLRISS